MNRVNPNHFFNKNEFRIAIVAALTLALFPLFVENVFSQKRNDKFPSSAKRTKPVTSKTARSDKESEPKGDSSVPVSVVNTTANDFLSGEVSISVNPKQPTVIRLGLAQNAVSIVEFPANDGIYYIHEGNPKLASVFMSPTKESDRSITIYPGESFLPSRDGSTSSSISLQMRSGLVLILELVPVSDLRKNAHRCVIYYDRETVIAARRAVGLAYNLGDESAIVRSANSKAASKLVGSTDVETSTPPASSSSDPTQFKANYVDMRRDQSVKQAGKNKKDISYLANKRLAECIKDAKKNFKLWSKPQSGLQISAAKLTDVDDKTRLAIIAVRNVSTLDLRLLASSPELQVQTVDTSGNTLQSSRLNIAYIETTNADGLLTVGATVYYALVYQSPILGVNQTVKVLVTHREAADAPVGIALVNSKTKE
ncbi:MAG: hypothetical protein HS105_05420 [Chloracidobacterium sp.]|nr:hypothetical protein [Chloracidobacterium sp.]